MNEIWKTINGFPNYEISPMGRVRNKITGKIRKSRRSAGSGYWQVNLSYNGVTKFKTIHRLVLLTYVGVPAPRLVASHIDGNKNNNNLENLCWETQSENLLRRRLHGTSCSGEDNPSAKLLKADVTYIRAVRGIKPLRELMRMFRVSRSSIQAIYYKGYWKEMIPCENSNQP